MLVIVAKCFNKMHPSDCAHVAVAGGGSITEGIGQGRLTGQMTPPGGFVPDIALEVGDPAALECLWRLQVRKRTLSLNKYIFLKVDHDVDGVFVVTVAIAIRCSTRCLMPVPHETADP